MKRWFALLLLAALPGFAQNTAVRYDWSVTTIAGNPPSGALPPVLAVPNTSIQVYSTYPTTLASTYTDATKTTACPSTAQLTLPGTSVCVTYTDAEGNFGFWIAPGTYKYTETIRGVMYGPYDFSVGGTGGGTSVSIPNDGQPFTNANVVNILGTSHLLGNPNLITQCKDTAGIVVEPSSIGTNATTFDVQVRFDAQPQSGTCVVNGTGGSTGAGSLCPADGPINVQGCFAAKGDMLILPSCAVSAGSSVVTCSAGAFVSADVGKTAYVSSAGAGNLTLSATIAAVSSLTTVTLSAAAAVTQTSTKMIYGSDDTAAIQSAFNAQIDPNNDNYRKAIYFPAGNYLHHGLNFTNGTIRIYGEGSAEALSGTTLYALGVTDPGKINSAAQTVGIDISSSMWNGMRDLSIYGGYLGFADLAPTVNVLAGRTASGPLSLSVPHDFQNVQFITQGSYNTVLYGYEQTDFLNCQWETDTTTLGNLYLSSGNTPGFVSPWVNLVAPATSMTKINISGGRTVIEGIGKMVVMDNLNLESNYNVSIRDAYVNIGANSIFLSDTATNGTGAIRNVNLDTINVENVPTSQMVKITAPAWQWRINNVQFYSFTGGMVYSPYVFTNGFFDGEAMIDQTGQAVGGNAEFFASSCLGSVLHLGQTQPTASCTDFASETSTTSYVPGIASSGSTSRTYPLLNFTPAMWVKLGTWVGSASFGGGGDDLFIAAHTSNGASPQGNQQGFVQIAATTGNQTAAPNITGITAWQFGNASPFSALLIAATGGSTNRFNLSWDVWLKANTYALGNYTVDLTDGATWTPSGTQGTPPSDSSVNVGNINNVSTVAGRVSGSCPMATSTSCTFTIPTAFVSAPICQVSAQGATPIAAACSVSGTTVTVTAATPNSAIWGVTFTPNPF